MVPRCGIPEIDRLEDELAHKTPRLVLSLDDVPKNAGTLQISGKTRGLERLVDYTSLRRIVARGVGDRELEYIGRVTALEQLELADPKTPDLKALQRLSRLRLLSISNSARLMSLDGIESLSQMQLLSASNTTRLTSIDAIASLLNLRILFLAGGMYRSMRIASLRPLAGLIKLVKLVLSNIGVADRSLRPLAGLKNLRLATIPRYFPAVEFAMLERELPDATGNWREPSRA